MRGGLPPHPVLLSGPEVPVRIEQGQEVPVQFVQKVRVVILFIQELIEHPGVDSRGDPLSGVDAAVNPYGGLFTTTALADLAENQN